MKDKDKKKPVLKKYPLVSVVIPAYNEENHILKTLNSLIKLEYPKDRFEIVYEGPKEKQTGY